MDNRVVFYIPSRQTSFGWWGNAKNKPVDESGDHSAEPFKQHQSAKVIENTFDNMLSNKYFDLRYSKLLNQATRAKAKGNLDEAIAIYGDIYNKNNTELRAITGLADCYSRKGDFTEAQKYLTKAKKVMPNLDNVNRIERDMYFSIKGQENPMVFKYLKERYSDDTVEKARKMVEDSSPALKAALAGVPVHFGKIDPEALAVSDGFDVTLNKNELGTASPQVLAAVIAHEAVHSGDRDRDSKRNDTDSISEETDAFEEGAKVWIKYRNGLSEIGEDNAASKFLKGRDVLKNYIRDLYADNHAATQEYSPGHYEEIKKHEPTAVTRKTMNGFEVIV